MNPTADPIELAVFQSAVHSIAEEMGAALIVTRPVYFDGTFHQTPIYNRDLLHPGDTFAGPAIISEYSSATILPPNDILRVDTFGNLVLLVHGQVQA